MATEQHPSIYSATKPAASAPASWKHCSVCKDPVRFRVPREFVSHLRHYHCSKEGGSFVCRYGPNNVCQTLPVEGVSDRDYADHIARDHVLTTYPSDSKNSAHSVETKKQAANVIEAQSDTESIHSEHSLIGSRVKWTIYMSKVNLPAALNDPRLSRRETDLFTKTWGDSFDRPVIQPCLHLPLISRGHFKDYLNKISSRLKGHKNSAEPATASPESLYPPAFKKNDSVSVANIEDIPKVFLHSGFSLENPSTFHSVFPWLQKRAQSPQSPVSKNSSKLLQEKLSYYLDIVEVQIARQISQRSVAFFHAMSSHDQLQDELSKTCDAIKNLREKIHTLDRKLAKGPLDIMHLEARRSNHIKLYNKLKLMATVHQTQPTIQMLLATNDYVGALDLISTTQEVLTQELAAANCFRHLGSQLAELETLIDKMMQDDYMRLVTAGLNRPLTDPALAKNDEDAPSSDDISVYEEDKLVSLVLGLHRQHRTNFIDLYQEEACTTIKAVIKQTVIEAVSWREECETDSNANSLADQMRLLDFDQWLPLLKKIFANLLVILKRVKATIDVMDSVTELAAGFKVQGSNHHDGNMRKSNGSPTNSINLDCSEVDVMLSQTDFMKLTHSLKEALCSICDHAHDRCVKVMTARAKDGFLNRLTMSQFVDLSIAVEGMVKDCEKISGRRSVSLHGSLQSQANKFVNRFHEERRNKLSLILDNERWKQTEVPPEFQHLVNHIIASASLSFPDKSLPESFKSQECLSVKNEKFAVVGTVLMLLKMVVEYCQCATHIPSVSLDLSNRVIEILKMFNSRTCQLILGAGALQLVGLKTITTKNLALASRCLQLVIWLLPKVRVFFDTKLQSKSGNTLKHFEQILKDYTDHVDEINNKLISIMDGMLDSQLSSWNVKPPMPSVNFRSICKQCSKLHEAILGLLPDSQIQDIFLRINNCFKTHLRGQLIRLGVTNDGGPQHGLVMADLTFYMDNMQCLKTLEKLDFAMGCVWDANS